MNRFTWIILSALVLFQNPLSAEDALDKGLWWLYHAQYDKARESIAVHIQDHPKDPAGYFYLTAVDWWHLAQEIEYTYPEIQARMKENSQKTIETAERLFASSKDPKVKARACLYSGGAEGLWGRWLVTQKEWVDAYFAGKRGQKKLKQALKFDPELYDAYLGLGIYDYYTDTLSGMQAFVAFLLIRGDKERGLLELQRAMDKGERSQVEAMFFLVEIFTSEEGTPERALPLADALHKKFPQSPIMHLMEVSTLYTMKNWNAMLPEAEDFLKKSESETPWYTRHYINGARYCMGVAKLNGKKDFDGAEKDFGKIIAEADPKSRWGYFAQLRLGHIYDLRKDREKALAAYQVAKSGPDIWGLHHEAEKYIDEPFTFSTASAEKAP